MENEQADAGRDGRTRLARHNSQSRSGTGKFHFPYSVDHEQDWQPYLVHLLYFSMNVCMYVCMVTHIARVWINRVRLPILHVVSLTGKMNISLSAFAPENLISRDGFGSPVPREPAHLHTQAESGPHLRDSSRVARRRPFIYLKPPYAIGLVPSLLGHAIAYRWM